MATTPNEMNIHRERQANPMQGMAEAFGSFSTPVAQLTKQMQDVAHAVVRKLDAADFRVDGILHRDAIMEQVKSNHMPSEALTGRVHTAAYTPAPAAAQGTGLLPEAFRVDQRKLDRAISQFVHHADTNHDGRVSVAELSKSPNQPSMKKLINEVIVPVEGAEHPSFTMPPSALPRALVAPKMAPHVPSQSQISKPIAHCKETIGGIEVPSWVPDALTTKTCKTR